MFCRLLKDNFLATWALILLFREFFLDNIASRTEGLESKVRSYARKATLIKSFFQALSIYTMSTFKIPKTICKKVDCLVKNFW